MFFYAIYFYYIYVLILINNIMKEIWQDIINYEGLYQVSNTGRIRSMIRTKGILKPFFKKSSWTLTVNLKGHDGRTLQPRVEILVMESFEKVSNIGILHLDGKQINCAYWNMVYSYEKLQKVTNGIITFKTIGDASITTNEDAKAITMSCKTGMATEYGTYWNFIGREVWLPIPGEAYLQASNLGRIRNDIEENIEVFSNLETANMVANTFLPKPFDVCEVRHGFEGDDNNSVYNLRWIKSTEKPQS